MLGINGRAALCVAILSLAAGSGLAQMAAPPPVMNFQGRLTDAAGQSVPDGTNYTVTVSLWDAATAGTMKWSQTLNGVTVKNGTFSALLTVDTANLFDGDLWLQTQIGTDPAMAPRQRVASVPYALKAGAVPDASITASKFAANALGGLWQTGGNAGTSPTTAFLGTTDNAALAFRTNNVERLRITPNGNVGIGVSNPDAPLTFPIAIGEKIDLYPNANGNYGIGVAPGALQIHSDSSSTDVVFGYGRSATLTETARITGAGNLLLRDKGVLALGSNVAGKELNAGKIGYEVFSPDALDIVGAGTDNTNRKVKVYAEGGTTFTGEVTAPVVNILGGSDVAEPYDVAPSQGVRATPGMVVCIDPSHVGRMTVADSAYSPMVAGIISGANGVAPGITLRQKGTIADGALPVATMGRVWALCDADANGAIAPGDMLTSSDTPGHAMRATDTARRDGAVIGKAMSSLKSGKGFVLVLVSLK